MEKQKLKQILLKYDWIITVCAVLTVLIFIIDSNFLDHSGNSYLILEYASWTIWFIFSAEIFIKWYVSEVRLLTFIRQNYISIIVLTLPLIRSLRFIKIIKINKLFQQFEAIVAFKDMKKLSYLKNVFRLWS